MSISKFEAVKKLESVRGTGRFAGVTFIKRSNGEERPMTFKHSVEEGGDGSGFGFNPLAKGLLPVWDANKRDFRMVNLDQLKEVAVDGERYTVE